MPNYSRVPNSDDASDSPRRGPASSFSISVQAPTPTSTIRSPAAALHTHPSNRVSISIPRNPSSVTSPLSPPSDYADSDEDNDNDVLSPTSPIRPPGPRFIKCIGQPKDASSGDQVLDVDPLTGAPIKPTPSSVVNAANPDTVLVDVLEAANEDPFTLEPFESLIALCLDSGKDFILARVTTVDPHDENRLYYSYYAAHHLNKVLFRTQPEEGLLHRMKAKNPLNNMTIVGDVHYYVVSTADPTGTPIEDVNHNDRRNSFDSVRSSAASFRSFASARSGGAASSIRSMLSVLSVSSAASGQAGARREFDGFRWRKKSRGRSAGSSSGDPLLHPEQEGGGLSRLLGMGGNGGNRKRTLHLIMRPDAVADGVEDVVSLTEEEGGRPGGSSGSKNGRIRQRPSSAQPLSTSGQKESRSRRNSMDDAYVEEVEGEDTTEGSAQGKGNSSRRGKDKATGTGVALRPGSTTPKIHRRVRSISFSNEQQQQRSRGGLGTGEALNVQEWIQSHDTDLPADVDQDDQTLVRPRPTRINTASNHPRPKNRTPLLEQALLSPSPPTTYIARYYASDDDFLMKSTVRAYFKQHALETSDAVLFTIPSSSTVEPQDILEGTEAHPALTGFVYAVSEEGTGWMGMGGRGAGRIVKWIMMGYIVIGFLLIKFIVPAPYAYITAFVLIFLMCLVMILCM